jgi:hypothetical protein
MSAMTRRSALRAGLGFPLGLTTLPGRAFAAKEFWNERKPEEWTSAEIKELLTRSPWAKDGEIKDNGQVGSLGSPRGGGRRGATRTGGQGGTAPSSPPKITWKAMVRWDSAMPVREALKGSAPKDVKDFYVLNVLGNLPGAIPSENEPADRASLEYLKETTKLQHKGDEIHLSRVEPAPASELSEAGTWFYFSRMLALMPEDKETTFVTKIGPLDVKCKFTLKDMLYRGNLEL